VQEESGAGQAQGRDRAGTGQGKGMDKAGRGTGQGARDMVAVGIVDKRGKHGERRNKPKKGRKKAGQGARDRDKAWGGTEGQEQGQGQGSCGVVVIVVWSGVVWCVGVVWCDVVWCGVVWFGVLWCGVVWYGVVWSGVVWCGVVRERKKESRGREPGIGTRKVLGQKGKKLCDVVITVVWWSLWCGVVWCGLVCVSGMGECAHVSQK
jgi:hypothetical protein